MTNGRSAMVAGSRATLAMLAVATVIVPACCVYLGDFAFWQLTGRPERVLEDPHNALFQACLTGAALLLLTLFGCVQHARGRLGPVEMRALRVALLVATLITVLLWLYYYWSGYVYWRDAGTGGADIGLGVVMLALPLLAGLPMALAYHRSVRAARRR